MPAIVKLAIILLVIILLLLKLRMNLGLALLAGVVLTGLLFRMPPGEFFDILLRVVISANALCFLLLVIFVVLLSHLMEKSGHLRHVVERVGDVMGSGRRRLATLPAIIGMLPMPGGAIFSAPMVREASSRMDLDPARKTAINHWFRHVWEFCWPLYPGVLAYQEQLGKMNLTLARVIGFQFPLTLFMVLVGFLLLFPHGLRKPPHQPLSRAWAERIWRLFVVGMPIVIVVAIFAGLQPAANMLKSNVSLESEMWTAQLKTLCARLPLLIALLVSIAYVLVANKLSPRDVVDFFTKRSSAWKMSLMVLGIVTFGGIISHSGAAREAADFFRLHGMEMFVIVGVPFIIGLITGITVAFVSISFPLIIPLVIDDPHKLAYAVLAYCAGFVAVMVSPAHLCLVLGRGYFRAGVIPTYRYLLPSSAVLMGVGVAWYFLLRLLGV
jgi:hypothetical protein